MVATTQSYNELGAPVISPVSPGLAVARQPLAPLLRAVVRNPLDAFPPEVFREPLVMSRVRGRTRLFLCDPALIHEAFVTRADCLTKGTVVRRALGFALGDGLLTAEGAHWRWQRAAVAPAFAHARLLGCIPAMIAAAETTRDRWLGADSVRLGHEMTLTTFDIIVQTMLSGPGAVDVARMEQGVTDYLAPTPWIFALNLLGAPERTPYPGRRRARRAVTFLRRAMTEMVAARRRGDPKHDLVSLLLDASDPADGRAMTDTEVADNLLTFISAGHETTAVGLFWTIELLARHPDIADRMRAEIADVTQGGALRPVDVPRLTFARQAFQEAMRLYPPSPILTRTAAQDFRLGSHTVPAGTVLYVPVHAVHRHAALWDAPDAFDPDRFSPERAAARHRHAYLPFGAGPRTCIGAAFSLLEAQAILGVLLPAIRLGERPAAMPVPVMRMTLRPAREAALAVTPRRG